jgi:hypothetical protein
LESGGVLYLIGYGLSGAIDVNNRVPGKNRYHKNNEDDDGNNYPFTDSPTTKALSSGGLSRSLRGGCDSFNWCTAFRAEGVIRLQLMTAFHAKFLGQLLRPHPTEMV